MDDNKSNGPDECNQLANQWSETMVPETVLIKRVRIPAMSLAIHSHRQTTTFRFA